MLGLSVSTMTWIVNDYLLHIYSVWQYQQRISQIYSFVHLNMDRIIGLKHGCVSFKKFKGSVGVKIRQKNRKIDVMSSTENCLLKNIIIGLSHPSLWSFFNVISILTSPANPLWTLPFSYPCNHRNTDNLNHLVTLHPSATKPEPSWRDLLIRTREWSTPTGCFCPDASSNVYSADW